MNNNVAHIEPANFNAVRPTARAVADLYIRQFHLGGRTTRDPVPDDALPAFAETTGATHRFDFTTATGATGTIWLGAAASGGWQVKARQRAAATAS